MGQKKAFSVDGKLLLQIQSVFFFTNIVKKGNKGQLLTVIVLFCQYCSPIIVLIILLVSFND